jgi:hypothetical protein
MPRIAHIINPFKAPAGSDLEIAQPITIESIRQAKDAAEKLNPDLKVELLCATFPEDLAIIPPDFKNSGAILRSAADFGKFEIPLKLPLIADILQTAYNATDAEWIIYSNIDIGLHPSFYCRVAALLDEGYDAMMINRRRIPARYHSPADLPKILLEKGKSHPGFDCFVLHRSLIPKLRLEKVCIGVPFVEITLSQNIFALAGKWKIVADEWLTFHVGMEIFRKRAPKEYLDYNRGEYRKAIAQLWPSMDSRKLPYANLPPPLRWIEWGLHPCIPIKEAMKLEWQRVAG